MKNKKNIVILSSTLIVLIALGIGGYIWKNKSKDNVPEEYEYSQVIKKGFIVKVTEGYESQVVNLNSLDEFIKNVENKTESKISIIEYAKKDSKLKATSLMNLSFDGKEINISYFNTEDQNNFKEEKTENYEKIVKIGDNTNGKVVALKTKIQSPTDGDVLFVYQQSSVKEYK